MTKILLVDDDMSIQKVYFKVLSLEGFRVYQATNAENATEILITRKIDLVLLDINMPGIDGVFLREVIDEYDSGLKVIVSSVYPLNEQRKRIPKADEYFDKSHGTEWLLACINRVMKLERGITKQTKEKIYE